MRLPAGDFFSTNIGRTAIAYPHELYVCNPFRLL